MIWYQDCLWVNTLIFVSLSLFSVEQVELQETDPWSMTGWSWGSADPSPSFFSLFSPVLHSISTNPLPSPRCPFLPPVNPVASHPSFLASNSSRPQSTVPNVLPGAGKHLHHRLHQSASEVWRAHCARVSRWQILSLTSRTHIFEFVLFLCSYFCLLIFLLY